ncbi:MAG: P-loop NTPase, partial [Clostridia bacterium]|nr:P-loop NTPase [Clostridia bacterium]
MNGRRIVFTSGKGGVGKSTVVANVGMELAIRGERVVLVDADIGLNNLDVALGLEKKVKYDLMEVALGKVRLK